MINWFRNLSIGVKVAIIAGIILIFLSCCCISSAALYLVIKKPHIDQLEDSELGEEDSLEENEMDNGSDQSNKGEDEEEDKENKKPVEKKVINLNWEFENSEGPAPEYAQRSKITLVISGDIDRQVYIGTYNGTAWDEKKSGNWTPPDGALMACAVSWAGEANEIAVFQTAPNKLTIRHRLSYEEDTEPSSFSDLKSVDISVSTASGSVNPEVKVQ